MIYTIDTDNNITAHDAMPAAQDNLVVFASQKELSKATAEWPASRLVETWNSFAGTSGFDNLKPVKKFTDRKAATTRIWAAIQNLGEEVMRTSIRDAEAKLKAARTAPPAPTPQAAPKPAKKAKATKAAKAAANAPTDAPDASTPRVPREFSKKAIVRDLLTRAGGATLQEIKDTLVMFTADHSFDLRIVQTLPKGTPLFALDAAGKPVPPKGLTVIGHHAGEPVLVAADGPGAERIHGFLANTDLFQLMLQAWGWKPDDGATH